LIAGQTIGFLGVGLYSWGVIETMPKELPRWQAYLLPAYCGLGFFFASVVPLLVLRDDAWTKSPTSLFARLREILLPIRNRRFAAFILFGCWVQLSIGLTQATQHRFGMFTLGITMLPALCFSTTTRLGQWSIGSWTGRLLDRFGNLRIMSWSLFVVSFGSLFYAVAENSTWWLVLGAAILWIFWVGVNIGISKTILDLSPSTDRAAYFALYFATTTLALALSTLFGGYFFADAAFDRYSFVLSWILRLLAIPLLWCVFGIRHEK
jgi:MFS family permease